jgi:hypothetical protein
VAQTRCQRCVIIRQISTGDNVEVSFPTLTGATVKGVIIEIGALAQRGNAFLVKVMLKNTTRHDIRFGMTAQVFSWWRIQSHR